jgi:stalled ribosome alternative rescue factor ArfA
MEAGEHIEQLLKLDQELTTIQKKEWKDELVFYINHLLLNDFSKLVQILYKADINEERLKELLKENPETSSALIIADLLVQRQEEKNKTRESFQRNEDISDDDKW